MENLIQTIIKQEGRVHALTIYLSILIAYLEQAKWHEAQHIILLLEKSALTSNESKALAYLSVLWETEDLRGIDHLSAYLSEV